MAPLKPTFALVHADGSVEQTTTTKAEARDVAFRWKMNQKVVLRVVELVEKPRHSKPRAAKSAAVDIDGVF